MTTADNAGFARLLGRAQRARVDAQDLLAALRRLSQAIVHDSATGEGSAETAGASAEAELAGKPLAAHMTAIEEVLNANPEVDQAVGDVAWRIYGDLKEAQRRFPKSVDASTMAAIADTEARLERIEADAASLTVGNRLSEHLQLMGVGKALDFDAAFADEVPDPDKRQRLLEWLAAYEHGFGGVVDVGRGLVYKVSRSKFWRVMSYLSPLIFALLAGGFLFLVGSLDNLGVGLADDWHLNNRGQLVSAYLLVLAGAILHLVVENIKQKQSEEVPILAIGDALEWLHLRWAGIALSLIPVVIVVIGLRVMGVGEDESDLGLYLAAGYSVDSIAGLFLTRFDTGAKKALRRLSKDIEGRGGGDGDGGGGSSASAQQRPNRPHGPSQGAQQQPGRGKPGHGGLGGR